MRWWLVVTTMLSIARVAGAAERNLVPEMPGTAPDYFCTWNVQGFTASYAGADRQADQMVEANLFGKGPNQGWLDFYPRVRADLIFLLDDAYDFPISGGHNHPSRGSIELDAGRFPSYTSTPAERLASLSRDVRARGWRTVGLWVCNSRSRLPGQEQVESDAYWAERLGWSQQAGIAYWKVDWGIGDRGKPLWKFRVTPAGRAAAPDVWVEFGTQGDVYRTYDVGVSVSIPETIRRVAAFLAKEDPKDHRMINCEDEVYIGAGTGCHYGIMRHPLAGDLPNGKPDGFFPAHFRDVKRRMDEVTRAVRWHRIAQPLYKGGPFEVDSATLTDFKSKPAPARIARGGLSLPAVTMPAGQEPPYVLATRHPDGEIAIATVPRNLGEHGRAKLTYPLADVTLEAGPLDHAIGVFGRYGSLTLVTTADLTGKRILAQDLAGDMAVDVTADVTIANGRLTIPGSVVDRVGTSAATPGDVSDPGLVLAVEGVTRIQPKPAMKPARPVLPEATTQ